MIKIVVKGLAAEITKKSVYAQNDFWFTCRGQINMNPIGNYDEIRRFINQYWDSHRNNSIRSETSPFSPSESKLDRIPAVSNRVSRYCDYCDKYPERKRIAQTHDTS